MPLLLAATPGADTPNNLIVRTFVVGSKVVKLHLANLQKSPTKVTLETLTGKEIYAQTIVNRNGYQIDLNLDGLAEGRYVLKVLNGTAEPLRQVVVVDDAGVLCSQFTK